MTPGEQPSEPSAARVAAIVVTFNRTDDLMRCLEALDRQTRRVDRVYLIDNGDPEQTARALETSRLSIVSRLDHIKPAANVGGAGGFCIGMERAYEDGFDWLWLMDDDVVPEPSALAELFDAHSRMPIDRKPLIVASRVVWLDGRPLRANDPKPKRRSIARGLALDDDIKVIRLCTFASVMIGRAAIARYGYPFADYFTIADDTEYTYRVLKTELGVVARRSIAWHNTTPQRVFSRKPERFYFLARNYIWMMRDSDALTRGENLWMSVLYVGALARYVISQWFAPNALSSTARGVMDGLRRRPAPHARAGGSHHVLTNVAASERPSRIESAIP